MKILCRYVRTGYQAATEDGRHRSFPEVGGRPVDAARIVAEKLFGLANFELTPLGFKEFEVTCIDPAAVPMANPKRFELGRIVDTLKSNWHEWECDAEMPDGSMVHGSVQADSSGGLIAAETFQKD